METARGIECSRATENGKGSDGENVSNETSRGFHTSGGAPVNSDPIVEDFKGKIEEAKKEIVPIPLDEDMPRRTVVELMDRQPVYFDEARIWWLWDHSLAAWRQVDDIEIVSLLDRHIVRVGEGKRITQKNLKDELMLILKMISRRRAPKEPKKQWVQFGKNIYDVFTGESFPATPEYFVVNPIPHEPDGSEETPTIDKLMEEWVGKEQVRQLQEVFAYACLPDYPIQVIFAFVGAGNNGKTTCLNLLKRFLGHKNCATARLENLVMAGARFESSILFKKLVCTMGETNIGVMKNTAYLKDLSGGDAVTIEFKGKDPFTDHNYAKIIMATNNLPATTDRTNGMLRRWLIIEFPNSFEGKENRFPLKDISDAEFSAFARKSSRILREVLAAGRFTGEGTLEERIEKYSRISNPFMHYLGQVFETEPDYSENYPFTQLVQEYAAFCQVEKKRALAATEVRRLLEAEGWMVEKDHFFLPDGRETTRRVVVGLKKSQNDKLPEKDENSRYAPIRPIPISPFATSHFKIGERIRKTVSDVSGVSEDIRPSTETIPSELVDKAVFVQQLNNLGQDGSARVAAMLRSGELSEPREGWLKREFRNA